MKKHTLRLLSMAFALVMVLSAFVGTVSAADPLWVNSGISDPTNPEVPTDSNDGEGEEKLSFFAKIWRAIVNFFRRLFGFDKK